MALDTQDRTCVACGGALTANCCDYQSAFSRGLRGEWNVFPARFELSERTDIDGRGGVFWMLRMGRFAAAGCAPTSEAARETAQRVVLRRLEKRL